jgi:cold shock protein
MPVAQGTVLCFDDRKGFGFIAPEEGGRNVFLHISALRRAGLSTLSDGQRVRYEVVRARGRESVAGLALLK